MDVGRRRSVVAGSVWESRMKHDEVRGGIKVFNGEEESPEAEGSGAASVNGGGGGVTSTRLKRGQTSTLVATSGKRKTWKSESFDGLEKSPFQISKRKPEPQKNSEEQCKELTVSAEGIKKSPVQTRKLRSEGSKEVGVSVEKFERSPVQTRKPRSEPLKAAGGESGEAIQRNSVQLRKVKSNSVKGVEECGTGTDQTSSVQLRKAKSESSQTSDESGERIDDRSVGGTENSPIDESGTVGSDETCKEFGVCEEKVITDRSVVNYAPAPKVVVINDEVDDLDYVSGEEGDEEEVDEEIEVDVKKVTVTELHKVVNEEKKIVNEEKKLVNQEQKIVNEEKKLVNQEQKIVNERKSLPIKRRRLSGKRKSFIKLTAAQFGFSNVERSPKIGTYLTNWIIHYPLIFLYEGCQSQVRKFTSKEKVLTSQVFISFDLLFLWFRTEQELNSLKSCIRSFISVISYVGLVYLAAIFIYRTLICRGVVQADDSSYVLGEQEAIWLLRLVLPYMNELLLKLRALFSGDPATTMKLAVLLFVLARCGSCITIWTVVKLGFLGVFIVPKICSLYSAQLTVIAKFWVRRFQDIWDSCSHKKAVAAAIGFLVLNLSSPVARIWEVFMLYVAFRCYQQSAIRDDWVEDEAGGEETS
ncbi:Reticulon-like protein B21 [Morella rubra]|uniref:Reticulon-like protein B21 n=1 Tax=Morella rubra TaxID=262757 RepID=A0A6A1VJ39_9ROSI|nr:Reticulon-like protein B21 [Morella rubra]